MIFCNLPTPPTPFVGRSKETEAITTLFADPACRLLTLVGPGGIGKTRMAQEIARRISEENDCDYEDGVYFVPLQALSSTNLMIPTIADEVGLTFFQTANQQQELIDYLKTKCLMLLLDNLEHLLEGVEIISAILAAAPGIKVLATSREALNLQEEWLYTVTGMTLPGDDNLEAIESFSAVRLFIQSARRVHPGFSVENERAGIARICELVGGMPLGLELAAAWVRALSCDEIADEIAKNVSILETSARNVPERHRTMRGVLLQSWAMLTEEEQQVMMRLAVFQGGFMREAAEAVANASLRVLSGLVDKSWLRWDSDNRRYDIHELLRQYAEEQLVNAGQAEATRDGHAAFFSGWMQKREGEIKFQGQDEALDNIERDFANVQLAWNRTLEQHHVKLVTSMIEAFNFFCDMRTRFMEGERLFTKASESFANDATPEGKLTYYKLRLRRARMILNSQTFVRQDISDLLTELHFIDEELQKYDCPFETAFVTYQLGFAQSFHSYDEIGTPYFTKCIQIYAQLGDLFYKADALHLLATATSDYEQSKQYYEEAFRIQEEIGDRNGIGWSLTQLARSNYVAHCYDLADQYNQRATTIQRARKDWKGLHYSLINQASWSFRRGLSDAAITAAEESLHIATTMNMLTPQRSSAATLGLILIVSETDIERGQSLCLKVMSTYLPLVSSISEAEIDALNGLTIVAYLNGDITRAQEYYQQLREHNYQNWITQTKSDKLVNLTAGILILDLLGKTEQAVEVTARLISIPDEPYGPAIGWAEKSPLLCRLRVRWEAELGSEVYAAAWARGMKRDIAHTVEFLLEGITSESKVEAHTATPINNFLTPREQEVLALLASGLSNREIAEKMVFSLGTVKWYVNQIYSKLGVGSRTQAIVRANEMQLLS